MPNLNLTSLRERLLRGGVAPKHVRRAILELQDHLDDLKNEAEAQGQTEEDVEHFALTRMGNEDAIAADVLARPELRSWASRWPWAVYTLGPIFVGVVLISVMLFGPVSALRLFQSITPGYVPSEPFVIATAKLSLTIEYIWAPMTTVIICLYGLSRRCQWGWLALAISLILVPSYFLSGVGMFPTLPLDETGALHGTLQFGFGYSGQPSKVFETLLLKVLPSIALFASIMFVKGRWRHA